MKLRFISFQGCACKGKCATSACPCRGKKTSCCDDCQCRTAKCSNKEVQCTLCFALPCLAFKIIQRVAIVTVTQTSRVFGCCDTIDSGQQHQRPSRRLISRPEYSFFYFFQSSSDSSPLCSADDQAEGKKPSCFSSLKCKLTNQFYSL